MLIAKRLLPSSGRQPSETSTMSVSVQQLLADVKRLAGRLKDHDSSADLLLSQAQAMYRQVDAMKEVTPRNE